MKLSKNWEFYVFLAVLLLASFLRFYRLATDPPGLYIDEASIGYNAYTILTKGVDEFGAHFPLWFRSFGDYKMPVYIYLTSLSMAFLGKSELAVRLPSAIAGVGSVVMIYFNLRLLINLDKEKNRVMQFLPLLSTFCLAISSWAIQFSRGGFEVNVACFLFLIFTYYFLKVLITRKPIYFFTGLISAILTTYTYHSFRVITPLALLFAFAYLFRKRILSLRILLIAIIFCGILYLPIIQFSLTPSGSERFVQTSTFSEYAAPTILDKVMIFPLVFVKNYISFFSFQFLFIGGDGIGRHQIPGFGVLPKWTLPFLLLGLYIAVASWKRKSYKFILFMLALAPLPATLARPSPHSLRSLLMVVPLTILIAVGLLSMINRLGKRKNLLILIIVPVILFESIYYLHFYYYLYPRVNSLDWGAGYKEIVEQATALHSQYPEIVVDKNLNYAPVYFNFYNPSLHITMVDNSWRPARNNQKKKILYIRPNYAEREKDDVVGTVYLPNNDQVVYAELKKIK